MEVKDQIFKLYMWESVCVWVIPIPAKLNGLCFILYYGLALLPRKRPPKHCLAFTAWATSAPCSAKPKAKPCDVHVLLNSELG